MNDNAYESITLRSADDTVRCRLMLTNDEKLVAQKRQQNEQGEWTDLPLTEGRYFIISLRSNFQRFPSKP
jgi:hypothetical protein